MGSQFTRWFSEVLTDISRGENRRVAVSKALQTLYNAGWLSVSSRWPLGTNVFSREWDLLVILDACRVDALREVSDEYEFLSSIETIWSVGSATLEWTAKTFTHEYRSEIAQTAYISPNPFTETALVDHDYPPFDDTLPFDRSKWDVVDGSTLETLDVIWQDGYDERVHTVPADYVTDRAIRRGRSGNHQRLIVHYNQPHVPYIGRAVEGEREPTEVERDPWPSFLDGTVSRSDLWSLYLDNLRYVLDQVEELLQNIDAECAVITADHGEAFGEWGGYAHPLGFPHPAVKRVPWAVTQGVDRQTRSPEIDTQEPAEVSREAHLRDLGYL